MTTTTTTKMEALYQDAKLQLETGIRDGIPTIFMVGSGGNGKTHLSGECMEIIQANNYLVDHETGYSMTPDNIKNLVGKNIIHLPSNPHSVYGLDNIANSVVIDMSHLHW